MSVTWLLNSSFPGNAGCGRPCFITRRSRWFFFFFGSSTPKFCHYFRMRSKVYQPATQYLCFKYNSSLSRGPFYNMHILIYNSLILECELGQHILKLDRSLALRRTLVKHFWEMVKMISFLWESKTHLHGGGPSVVTGPVTWAWLNHLFKVHIFRPPESQTPEMKPSDVCLHNPPGESAAH